MKHLLLSSLALLLSIPIMAQHGPQSLAYRNKSDKAKKILTVERKDKKDFYSTFVRVGAGFNGTMFYSNMDDTKYNNDMFVSGGSLSLMFGRRISGKNYTNGAVFVEAGPELAFGVGSNTEKLESKIKLFTVSLPVNLRFNIPISYDNDCVVLFVGVCPKYNGMAELDYQTSSKEVSGVMFMNGHKIGNSYTTVVKDNTIDLLSKDDMGDEYAANMFQVGAGGGIGLELGHVLISYRFMYDIIPFQSYNFNKEQCNTHTLTHNASISYVFGK